MVVVRKTAVGRVHYRAFDAVFDGRDTADVSGDMADYLTETGDFERVSDDETGGSDAEDAPADGEAGGLTDLDGVGEDTAADLRDLGFGSATEVRSADIDDLTEVAGIGEATAESLTSED